MLTLNRRVRGELVTVTAETHTNFKIGSAVHGSRGQNQIHFPMLEASYACEETMTFFIRGGGVCNSLALTRYRDAKVGFFFIYFFFILSKCRTVEFAEV